MKYLFVFLFLVSCVHTIDPTLEESCAANNMILESVTTRSGSSTYDFDDGGSTTINRGSSKAECSKPKTEIEKCEIAKRSNTYYQAQDFNNGLGSKNFIVGVGYVFWIIPGIVAYNIYDNQRDAKLKGIREALSTLPECRNNKVVPVKPNS